MPTPPRPTSCFSSPASTSASAHRASHGTGSSPHAWTYAWSTANDGSRSPLAAFARVVAEKPAFFAMVR